MTYKAEAITLNVKNKVQSYPMYSTYVLQELRWLVAEKEGYTDRLLNTQSEEEKKTIQAQLDNRLNTLYQNGLTIYTALDPVKQNHDEERMTAILGNGQLQAAGAVINNSSREVVSLYAGKIMKNLIIIEPIKVRDSQGQPLSHLLSMHPILKQQPIPQILLSMVVAIVSVLSVHKIMEGINTVMCQFIQHSGIVTIRPLFAFLMLWGWIQLSVILTVSISVPWWQRIILTLLH